jgi:hypothetical protein
VGVVGVGSWEGGVWAKQNPKPTTLNLEMGRGKSRYFVHSQPNASSCIVAFGGSHMLRLTLFLVTLMILLTFFSGCVGGGGHGWHGGGGWGHDDWHGR